MKTSTKLSLVAGLLAGYVLGARAGRERYDQIAGAAQKAWDSKPVQKQVVKVRGAVDRYVPKAVESTFHAIGKVASNLVGKVLGGPRQAPTGTVDNPAQR
ncbi:hypothetical protein [Gulosibacter sp. 10]|uniref:hypothetical protein n=1 Tax=Gulosibacter sp. 10 TaxID=1255570 RepID=UPI00097F3B0E|nr:hypothetical protein [Gulosibacter sp. 10]SJM55095.1 hypothetical protein FM112_03860 [Gulosibacter sp. 10]